MRFKRTNVVLFVVVFEVLKKIVVVDFFALVPMVKLFSYQTEWGETSVIRLIRSLGYSSNELPTWKVSVEKWTSTVALFKSSEFWQELLRYLEDKGLTFTLKSATEYVIPRLDEAENAFLRIHLPETEETVANL